MTEEDADQDGWPSWEDCDDTSWWINPGQWDYCDGVDNDCDGVVDDDDGWMYFRDADSDGYGSWVDSYWGCSPPSGYTWMDGDCDDSRAEVHSGAPEVCDGVDNNCDGSVDESGGSSTWYRDADDDGFGNPGVAQQACQRPAGYVADRTDCNDGSSAIYPGATETCDGRDNDCDGAVDQGNPGGNQACITGQPGICAQGSTACTEGGLVCNANIAPGTQAEVQDGLDNDCDGETDEPPAVILQQPVSWVVVGVQLELGAQVTRVQPGDSVEFISGPTALCTAVANETTGLATCTWNVTTSGEHTVYARKVGTEEVSASHMVMVYAEATGVSLPESIHARPSVPFSVSATVSVANGPAISDETSLGGDSVQFLVDAEEAAVVNTSSDGAFVATGLVIPSEGTYALEVVYSGRPYAYSPSTDSREVVVDGTPPVVNGPSDIIQEAAGPAGQSISWSINASDTHSGIAAVSCSPASGSVFPVRASPTPVACLAVDRAGNQAGVGFSVWVRDTVAPTLTVPSSGIVVTATSLTGTVVSYHVSASDVVSGNVPVSCSRPSGTAFPVGNTTVTCTASDAVGNSTAQSFTVTVRDTRPPLVTINTPKTVTTSNRNGAAVSFTAYATDILPSNPTVTCSHASGSVFPVGRTTVRCSAVDAAGNVGVSTALVTVVYRAAL
ncbi:MAG: MopE-related protein [Myxococcota bacterium]